jgi:pimeloyl-ACP methyl ester carboxylesterase
MKLKSALLALAACAIAAPVSAQQGQNPRAQIGVINTDAFRTTYVRLGQQGEGLMYEPATLSPAKARLAIVYSHPSANVFQEFPAIPMSSRGYRILMVNYRGGDTNDDAYLPTISRGVQFMRTLPGVEKVVVMGHSGGGHLMTLYENVAEHGSAVCKDAAKLYPCMDGLDGLQKPDGFILLDPTLGAFHQMSSVDPANGATRVKAVDMFDAANGYDKAAKKATYSAEFAKRFYAAQSARNMTIVNNAVARMTAIKAGNGQFKNDEPLTIKGIGVQAAGARLYQADPTFANHTKVPRLLLKADGTQTEAIVHSVRGPVGQQSADNLSTLGLMNDTTTVTDYLRANAIRTNASYAITPDDITGVDWKSAYTATPGNAEGVTVPTLVMAMGCHYLIVPAEIIYDKIPAKDKSFAVVEGATHVFSPCQPQYGDTSKRTFDHVDAWLSKAGRF